MPLWLSGLIIFLLLVFTGLLYAWYMAEKLERRNHQTYLRNISEYIKNNYSRFWEEYKGGFVAIGYREGIDGPTFVGWNASCHNGLQLHEHGNYNTRRPLVIFHLVEPISLRIRGRSIKVTRGNTEK
ncbi:MAG: hypothetical protein KKD35_04920 [Elusimicrobia bacterium]|nr:hypothetical protein [Elusimicrobiota bacterium]